MILHVTNAEGSSYSFTYVLIMSKAIYHMPMYFLDFL